MNWYPIRKSSFVLLGILLYLSSPSLAQNDVLSAHHVPKSIADYTLLVVKYEYHDTNDVIFKQNKMSKKEIEKFLEKKNAHVDGLNEKLTKVFRKYHYNYRIVSSSDIDKYDPEKYRFVLYRFLVKRESLRKVKVQSYYTYCHYFHDRVKNKNFRDINIIYQDVHKSEKIIVSDLNDLIEDQL